MGPQGLAAHQKKARRKQANLIFLDESGFFVTPLLQRTWSPRAQTPVLTTRTRDRQHLSVIGALSISPQRRRMGLYLLFYPKQSLSGPHIVDFLRHLRRHIRGPKIVLLDNLGAHRGPDMRQFVAHRDDFELEYYPSYAPELNPIEYLWGYLKKHSLGHVCPTDLDDLCTHAARACCAIRPQQHLFRSFVAATHLPFRFP